MSVSPHNTEPHGELRGRVLHFGALTLDPDRRRAVVNGRDAGLSAAEFALLHLLVTRRGVAMSKEAIMDALFEGEAAPDPRIVDVWVLRIRSKLTEAGFASAIATVWGRGYMVAGPGDDGAHPMTPPRSWSARPQLALV